MHINSIRQWSSTHLVYKKKQTPFLCRVGFITNIRLSRYIANARKLQCKYNVGKSYPNYCIFSHSIFVEIPLHWRKLQMERSLLTDVTNGEISTLTKNTNKENCTLTKDTIK